ncbi:uncharacterized protein LOC128681341 [Plodia interpunctella]|uniref:uncharacterized protein LOC128681341 n=1 Tax=Plodia interpunctella TaxID=58824 RepID=UPI002367A473|nr:uncharacterized protein LOC128681341 [Plodia interpunctella]
MFGEKLVCAENNFSPLDLLNFVASLIRSSKLHEMRYDRSNYSWLSSRTIELRAVECDLDEFQPVVQKLTPENCAAIAVKLQTYADDEKSTSKILTAFKNLLEEQYSMQVMANVKGRGGVGKRRNKVRPILTPPGRQATVSFIL